MKEELFIIRNYDGGDILNIYLTDNAQECENVLYIVDSVCVDDEKKDIEKEHRKIWKDKCDGEWEYAFERECKRRKILLKNVSNIVIYDY